MWTMILLTDNLFDSFPSTVQALLMRGADRRGKCKNDVKPLAWFSTCVSHGLP